MPVIKKRILGYLAVCILASVLLPLRLAANEVVRLSTLDWPPYTGKDLPLGGATTEVVRAGFEKAGHRVEVEYRPWKRAIDIARRGTDGVVAYFPGYHCQHQDGFVQSEPVGNGPLGFAEHVDAPITWTSLDDIATQRLKIGTGLGYANTDEFDAMVGAGQILAVPSVDDTTNLKKLARRRLDAVVIDKLVLEYLKATEAGLKDGAEKLRFNARPLEEKTLYVCFRDDPEGKRFMEIFNSGLVDLDIQSIVETYFATAFSR